MTKRDAVWKSADVAGYYLEGVRAKTPLTREMIDVMLRVIRAAKPDGIRNYLDLGCGDGFLGLVVASAYPQAQGILLDFSEPMIDAAKKNIPASAPIDTILFDYGDPAWVETVASHAPFDVIVSRFSIHHQPDIRKHSLYKEIYNLLTPGGVFLNMEHVLPESQWIETLFEQLMVDALYAHEQQTGSEKTREQVAEAFVNREDKDANILAPLEDQLDWLREIGFEHVACMIRIYELALFGGLRPA